MDETKGGPVSSTSEDVRFTRTHRGWCESPLEWAQIEMLFDAIWGSQNRNLPTFPQIIGGIYARWGDALGAEHVASSLEELRSAYESRQTAWLSLSGEVKAREETTFFYLPATGRADFRTMAAAAETVERRLALVQALFPLVADAQWDSLSLTLIGIVYGIVVTVFGVIAARAPTWVPTVIWATVSFALLAWGLTIGKRAVITFAQKFLQSQRR